MKKIRLAVLPLCLLAGCASIVNGTYQPISISTLPTNAEIWVDNKLVGRSPLIVDLKRNNDHYIRIELDEYKPYEINVTRKVSGWVAGNLVFGGFIGIAIDAISGGVYKLTPEQIQVEMLKNDVAYSKQSEDSYIAIVLEPKSDWEKIGMLGINE